MVDLGISITHKELFIITEDSYARYNCRVGEVECLLVETEDYQVVAPRGTEAGTLLSGLGFFDVIRDLRFFPWYDKRVGWSHAGFLKGAQGLVDKGLFGMLDRDKPIVLTGHSLGGAISINAAAILKSLDFNVVAVCTFGAPRTLMKSAAKRFNTVGIAIAEFSNAGDPIPDLPNSMWGYTHINEVHTPREAKGYSIFRNHRLEHYGESFDV